MVHETSIFILLLCVKGSPDEIPFEFPVNSHDREFVRSEFRREADSAYDSNSLLDFNRDYP